MCLPKCNILPDILIENNATKTKHILHILIKLQSSTEARKYPDTCQKPVFTPSALINLWSLKFEPQKILQNTLRISILDAEKLIDILYFEHTEIFSHYSAGDNYLPVYCCPKRTKDTITSCWYSALHQNGHLFSTTFLVD